MAYGESDEGKKSIFNAGIAQTERIDGLQRAINSARFNPLQYNPETMTFNYEIIISANDGLLNEAWAKLSPEEQKSGEAIRKLVKQAIKITPPVESRSRGSGEPTMHVNKNNYEKIVELLNIYEKVNKELLDAHNLNAPNAEEEGFF